MKQAVQKIRIAIAGNCQLFREFFCIALKDEASIDIVADAENLHLAIDVIREHRPDIILLDIGPSEFNIAEILAEIVKNYPDTKVLVMVSELEDEDLQSMIKAGARGYISKKQTSKAGLISAIKSIQGGEFWIERKMTAKLLIGGYHNNFKTDGSTRNPKELLTAREKEVLCYLSKGLSNKEIASSFFISEKTVKCHVNKIFKKLNISSRIKAILFAIDHGFSQQTECGRQIIGRRS